VTTKLIRGGAAALGAAAFAACLSVGGAARADVLLVKTDVWELSTNGRVNGFLSYAAGDGYPLGMNNVLPGAGFESFQTDQKNQISAMRLRSGFVGSLLGFTMKRSIAQDTTLRAHFELWSIIENPRIKASTNYPDVREVYMKMEGPWGGLLVGRALALFSRGAIQLDFNLNHANGLGFPCNADGIGPTCGHVGFGVIFAGYNPQITYNTPSLGGFQLTVGLFDPVSLPGKYERTPYPRLEGEVTFDRPVGEVGDLHLFVNGLWQDLEQQGMPSMPAFVPRKTSSRGVGYGGWLRVLKLHVGFAAHYGYGLGIWNTLENTPQVADRTNTFRRFDGYYGAAGVTAGKVDLNVGVGVSRVYATPADAEDVVTSRASPVKYQRGESLGAYIHAAESLVVALEYFRADIAWYLGERQGVNFFNTGLTMTW
jgi:hypothetical protein